MEREIYLAGGCFWGTQRFLQQIRGIVATEVGYANGATENPTYEEVYTDTTGYAETVRVVYDPTLITPERIVALYFMTIDPLTLNKQGGDIGTRYRTGIYYTSPEEEPVLRAAYDREAAKYDTPLVVELEPLRNFYAAEEYHQDYLVKHPEGYCHLPLALLQAAKEL